MEIFDNGNHSYILADNSIIKQSVMQDYLLVGVDIQPKPHMPLPWFAISQFMKAGLKVALMKFKFIIIFIKELQMDKFKTEKQRIDLMPVWRGMFATATMICIYFDIYYLHKYYL